MSFPGLDASGTASVPARTCRIDSCGPGRAGPAPALQDKSGPDLMTVVTTEARRASPVPRGRVAAARRAVSPMPAAAAPMSSTLQAGAVCLVGQQGPERDEVDVVAAAPAGARGGGGGQVLGLGETVAGVGVALAAFDGGAGVEGVQGPGLDRLGGC